METELTLKKVIIDGPTGVETVIDLTADEIAERKVFAAEIKAEQEARTSARQSALVKLTALGLTEEEIAAL
jgi:DNA-binding NarL/FixJ family response regulator